MVPWLTRVTGPPTKGTGWAAHQNQPLSLCQLPPLGHKPPRHRTRPERPRPHSRPPVGWPRCSCGKHREHPPRCGRGNSDMTSRGMTSQGPDVTPQQRAITPDSIPVPKSEVRDRACAPLRHSPRLRRGQVQPGAAPAGSVPLSPGAPPRSSAAASPAARMRFSARSSGPRRASGASRRVPLCAAPLWSRSARCGKRGAGGAAQPGG